MFDARLPPPGSRAVLLARHSTNMQNPLSSDDQLEVCRKECERNGWEVVAEFKDEAKSGRSVAKRKGYLDMMEMAEAGGVDVICVFALDRLGRDARELHDAKNRLADQNTVIFVAGRGVMNGLTFALYAQMAEEESIRIAERTTRGARAAAARGAHMGDVSYGYKLVQLPSQPGALLAKGRSAPRKLEVDPAQAEIVLRANLDFDAGLSPHKIAEALTREGIPTPEGGPIWHPNTIIGVGRSQTGLLRNPLYVGKRIYGKTTSRREAKTGRVIKRRSNAADMIHYDEPDLRIVPQDVWDRNQERLAKRPPSKLRDRRRPSYLLSGLVNCGVCGGTYAMVAYTMGCTAARLNACSNRRRIDRKVLEAAVLQGLGERLVRPEVLELFIPEYVAELAVADKARVERGRRETSRLAEVEREIQNVLAQVHAGAGGGYARQILSDSLETLGAEKERLERLARQQAPERQDKGAVSVQGMAARLCELVRNLSCALENDHRDGARAREIIRTVISDVTLIPFDEEGVRPDGRGNGPLRAVVTGDISELVDAAMLDRKIMHKRGASDVHDHPTLIFRYYVDVHGVSGRVQASWEDVAAISRLLDDADRPILKREMEQAVAALGEREGQSLDDRTRLALAQLRRDGWARALRVGGTHGWVWADRQINDEEWVRRFAVHEKVSRAHVVVRVVAPEASVVVVGRRESDVSMS